MWVHARGADVALCAKKSSGPDAGNKVVSYIRTYAHQATEKIELQSYTSNTCEMFVLKW